MKKNNILWAVLPMMAAALMTTACSNDDNVNESPTEQSTIKTIPYSVTVNDGATTRATVDSDNKTLKFAAGDKLYITGTNIKGTLNIQTGTGTTSATFSGDLTYSGEGSPAADLTLTATLVSAQQTVGTEVSVNDAGAVTVNYPTTAYCDDVAEAVQKYSNLTGTSNYGSKSFTLSQQTAFLNFVISFTDGTASGTALSVVVKNGATTLCTANRTTVTDEGVKAKFVLPVASGTALSSATVTMGTKPALTITNASLTGKVYNVKRTQAAPALGDLYYSDGTFSSTLETGKTPIGVIAYLGTDAFTETGTNVGGSTFTGHGLVLCLKNAASGADAQWSTETSTYEFGGDAKVTNADGLKRSTNVSGYTNTKTLAEKTDAATKYKAAYAAKNYTGLMAPAGTTGWFLPSAQQWVKMQTGLGGLAVSAIVWGSWFNNDHSAATAWETAMAKAGTKDTVYDSMTDAYLFYWSSSEYSAYNAVKVSVDATGTGGEYGFYWYDRNKDSTSDRHRVRPVLAF